jgi:rubrerythrin
MKETSKRKAGKTLWRCRVCGYIHEGARPPERCPVCGADKSAFERMA